MTNNYIKAVARAENGKILAQTFAFFDDTDPVQCADAQRAGGAFSDGLSVFRRAPGVTLPVVGRGGGF